MLMLALGFNNLQDYKNAIAAREQLAAKARNGMGGHVKAFITSAVASGFEDAARDFLHPMTLSSEATHLKTIARGYALLTGDPMNDDHDWRTLSPDSIQGRIFSDVRTTLKEMGLADQWEQLVHSAEASPDTSRAVLARKFQPG